MLSQVRTGIKTHSNSRLVLDLFNNIPQLCKLGTYNVLSTGLVKVYHYQQLSLLIGMTRERMKAKHSTHHVLNDGYHG
jgi:hypothetical protein